MKDIKENDKIYVYLIEKNSIVPGIVTDVRNYGKETIHITVEMENSKKYEFWYYNQSYSNQDIFMGFCSDNIIVSHYAHTKKDNLIDYVKYELAHNIKLFTEYLLEFDKTNSTFNNITTDVIEFNGKTYPLISVAYNGQMYDIATARLEVALDSAPKDMANEARRIDETIFYYMDNEDYLKINHCRPYIIRDYIIENIIKKI